MEEMGNAKSLYIILWIEVANASHRSQVELNNHAWETSHQSLLFCLTDGGVWKSCSMVWSRREACSLAACPPSPHSQV
jgi:hypothetical protein